MQVRDIMIPRSQVVTVPADLTLSDIVELVTSLAFTLSSSWGKRRQRDGHSAREGFTSSVTD